MTIGGMTLTVEIGISSTIGSDDKWDTALWGTALWGPDTSWTDISSYVRSLNVRRGRQRETQRYEAGRATIRLSNLTGDFSPTNMTSIFVTGTVNGVRPWVPIRITGTYSSTAYGIFYGYVTSWSESYGGQGGLESWVDLQCVDEFGKLARFDGSGDEYVGDGESSSARINRILDAAGSTADRYLEAGTILLQEVILNNNATSDLQLTTDSEGGALWVDGSGVIRFENRSALLINARSNTVNLTLSDQVPAWSSYLSLPGSAGNYASIDDSSLLTWGRQLDLRVAISAVDWTPASDQEICGQHAAANYSFRLTVSTISKLNLILSQDGTATVTSTSPSAMTVADGDLTLIRAVWDGTPTTPTVVFWQKATTASTIGDDISSDIGWSSLGSTTTTVSALYNSTEDFKIGSSSLASSVYAVQVRHGVNAAAPLAVDIDFTSVPSSTTSFTSDIGPTVTVNQSGGSPAQIAGASTSNVNTYTDAVVSFAGDLMVNMVSYAAVGGDPVEVQDDVSRSLYGDFKVSRTDLLCFSDDQVLDLAVLDLDRRKNPEQRIEQVTIFPQRTPSLLWAHALGREIRDLIKVIRNPRGANHRITRYCFVGGISHSWSADSNLWKTSFNLDSATSYRAFTSPAWDYSIWGVTEWY